MVFGLFCMSFCGILFPEGSFCLLIEREQEESRARGFLQAHAVRPIRRKEDGRGLVTSKCKWIALAKLSLVRVACAVGRSCKER
jgi:hypothetical protein